MYKNENSDMRALGEAVKEDRENKGLSRKQLAEMIGLSPPHTVY